MKLYSKKQQWKQILFLVGIVIIVAIVWLTSLVVNNVKKAELEKIQLWSQAIKKKAELVRLTNEAFNELAQNESEIQTVISYLQKTRENIRSAEKAGKRITSKTAKVKTPEPVTQGSILDVLIKDV